MKTVGTCHTSIILFSTGVMVAGSSAPMMVAGSSAPMVVTKKNPASPMQMDLLWIISEILPMSKLIRMTLTEH